MASTTPQLHKQAAIPFWRDVRVLAIIAQIVFVVLVLLGIGWLIKNFFENAQIQGLKIGFDFLNTTAAFDIGEGIEYQATDSFGRALWVGMVNTIRVSILGIILTTVVGVITGIARLSNNWLISKIAAVYIEIIRNIPLLVLLFFLYFGIILKLPPVRDSIQPFGWPVFLNQRGVAIPGLMPTSGFPVWLAFVVLALVLALVVWLIQSRQEEKTGQPTGKAGLVLLVLLVVAGLGWIVTTRFNTTQGMMVTAARNIEDFGDFEKFYMLQVNQDDLRKLGVSREVLSELTSAEAVARLKEQVNAQIAETEAAGADAAALQEQLAVLNSAVISLCSVEGTVAEVNAASQLRSRDIAIKVNSFKTVSKAGAAYAAGDCDLLVGAQAELASERAILEKPETHGIVPVEVSPLIVDTPAPAGFNIQGGSRLTPEFASLLLGLVIYTGAFAAEIVRAGILAVSKGQTEAARSLGLSEGQRLRLIVLPQAMRVIIPPMTSQYLNLAKNSSLAVAIAFPDLVAVGNTVMNQSGFAVQVIMIFMVSYLTLSLIISVFLNWYNEKVALVER